MIKLDTHAHWFPQQWVETIEREGPKNGVEITRNEQGRLIASMPGVRLRPNFTPPYIDIPTRLKIMDEARVDVVGLLGTEARGVLVEVARQAPLDVGVEAAGEHLDIGGADDIALRGHGTLSALEHTGAIAADALAHLKREQRAHVRKGDGLGQ